MKKIFYTSEDMKSLGGIEDPFPNLGATIEQIGSFEELHDIKLPEFLKGYYQKKNGGYLIDGVQKEVYRYMDSIFSIPTGEGSENEIVVLGKWLEEYGYHSDKVKRLENDF